jgi:hypothetical protein
MTYDIPAHITGDTWDGIPLITFSENGSAINLTGASFTMAVKSVFNIASPNVLPLSTSASSISILSPASAGRISIPSRIVDIPVGNYSWSLTMVLSSGRTKTYLMGNWPIIPRVPFSNNWQEAPRII